MELKSDYWESYPERTVQEQLESLYPLQRESFEDLKTKWSRKTPKFVELDDFKLLRFLRNSPGKHKFNVEKAWKVLLEYEKLAQTYPEVLVNFSVESVQKRLLKGIMLPLPDSCLTKHGHQILYLQICKFFPGTDSLQNLTSCLLYVLEWMTRREKTCTEGIYIIYDLKGFSWRNFSLATMRSIISIAQGRFPCRIRNIFIVNPPAIFGLAFALTRPTIPVELREKIHVINNKATLPPILFGDHSIQKAINLPKEIGGALDFETTMTDFITYRKHSEYFGSGVQRSPF